MGASFDRTISTSAKLQRDKFEEKFVYGADIENHKILVVFLLFSETNSTDKEKSIFVASEAVFYDFVTGLAGYRAVITGGSRS